MGSSSIGHAKGRRSVDRIWRQIQGARGQRDLRAAVPPSCDVSKRHQDEPVLLVTGHFVQRLGQTREGRQSEGKMVKRIKRCQNPAGWVLLVQLVLWGYLKPRLHVRFLMQFCDAILATKPLPAHPARVFRRVRLRQNPAKFA